jgi:tetratricopeptide (TPR) repeat protein
LEDFLKSQTVIVGLCSLFLVIAFFLFKPQFSILLNRLAKIQFRGVKNLQYIDQDIDQESEPELQIQSWLGLPNVKFVASIVIFAMVSFIIFILFGLFSRVLVQLGNAEFSAGYEKLGIATYNLALEFNQALKEAVNNCYAYNTQQEYELAIQSCSKAIEIDPNYAAAYFRRGYAYLNLRKYDQAIADFTKDIELIPVATRSYINRGTVYMHQQKYDLAISDLSKSIEINPTEPQAWLDRGLVYILQNKSELAIPDCQKAIELEEKYWNAYFCLGRAFSNQGKYESAIDNFNKAIELAPTTEAGLIYCMQGITYSKLGDFQSAVRVFEQGVKIDVTNENDWCKAGLDNAQQRIQTP